MLGFTEIDVKQTRFYQDVFAEGRQGRFSELRRPGLTIWSGWIMLAKANSKFVYG
jgi:predicted transposase YdaD